MCPTKVSIANNKGFESITAISRAFEVGHTSRRCGTVKVHLGSR